MGKRMAWYGLFGALLVGVVLLGICVKWSRSLPAGEGYTVIAEGEERRLSMPQQLRIAWEAIDTDAALNNYEIGVLLKLKKRLQQSHLTALEDRIRRRFDCSCRMVPVGVGCGACRGEEKNEWGFTKLCDCPKERVVCEECLEKEAFARESAEFAQRICEIWAKPSRFEGGTFDGVDQQVAESEMIEERIQQLEKRYPTIVFW